MEFGDINFYTHKKQLDIKSLQRSATEILITFLAICNFMIKMKKSQYVIYGDLIMLKIKDKLYSKIIQSKMGRISLTLLLDLIQFADNKGELDIYYKDYTEEYDVSVSQFYAALATLQKEGFIRSRKESRRYIKIEIFANSFEDKKYTSYRDINSSFFVNRTYAALPGGMIRMHMRTLQACMAKRGREAKGNENKIRYTSDIFEKFAKICRLKNRTAKAYFKRLEQLGLIKFYDKTSGAYYVRVNDSFDKVYSNENYTHDKYVLKRLMSEIGSIWNFDNNHIEMVNQYRKAAEKAKFKVEDIVNYVLLKLKKESGSDEEISVSPARFNSLIKNEIDLFRHNNQYGLLLV